MMESCFLKIKEMLQKTKVIKEAAGIKMLRKNSKKAQAVALLCSTRDTVGRKLKIFCDVRVDCCCKL